jgi:hypothetical protein
MSKEITDTQKDINFKDIILAYAQERHEGQVLWEIIENDTGRKQKEIAKLLDKADTQINKKRLYGVKTLSSDLATKATLLYNLPRGTFANAVLPVDYDPVRVEDAAVTLSALYDKVLQVEQNTTEILEILKQK